MGTRMACWPVEPTLKLVIPLYCGRKNKVTVVFVSFLLGMDKKEWKEKKKKERCKKTRVKVLEWPQTIQPHTYIKKIIINKDTRGTVTAAFSL